MITRVLAGASLAALVLAGGLGVTGVSAGDSEITIKTFQFRPTPIEVAAGTRVTWTNMDDITHTVTSGAPESRNGRFNAPLAGKGRSFDFTFTEPGTYPYFCDRHPSMRGEIQVK